MRVINFLKSLFHLFIVANWFKDCSRPSWLHLNLMGSTKNNFTIEINLRNHSLWVDDEILFVSPKVVVFFKEVLGLNEIFSTCHEKDLAILYLFGRFFSIMSIYLRPDEFLNNYLIWWLLWWKACISLSSAVLLIWSIILNSIATINYQSDFSFFDKCIAALSICSKLIVVLSSTQCKNSSTTKSSKFWSLAEGIFFITRLRVESCKSWKMLWLFACISFHSHWWFVQLCTSSWIYLTQMKKQCLFFSWTQFW